MPLVLEPLSAAGTLAIDLGGVVPDRIAAFSVDQVRRLEVRADERPVDLGSLFDVAGAPADGLIECRGDFSRTHSLGARMGWGEILVTGDVGRHAGEGMTGGRLTIHGDAGDWLGCEMAGGSVHVKGNAGDNVAAALPGSRHGMRGGLLTVAGAVGSLAGARMRRGVLAVGGACGPAAALEMLAGTIIVGGTVGPHAACGMRRGSLVAAGGRFDPQATFRRGAVWAPTFLQLLAGRLDAAGFLLGDGSSKRALAGPWEHWHGDLLTGGRGELFLRPTA